MERTSSYVGICHLSACVLNCQNAGTLLSSEMILRYDKTEVGSVTDEMLQDTLLLTCLLICLVGAHCRQIPIRVLVILISAVCYSRVEVPKSA